MGEGRQARKKAEHLFKVSIECYYILGTVLGIGATGNVQSQKYFLPLRSFTSSGELDINQTLTQINLKLQL